MVSTIDYESLITEINKETSKLLKKFDIQKDIPFKVDLSNITVQGFLKQFDIYIDSRIQQEIIPQIIILQEKNYAIQYDQKLKELEKAYQTFNTRNAEFYDVLIPKKTPESRFLLKSSIEQSTLERSKMKALIKDEKSLKAHLEQEKLYKMRLIEEKHQQLYQAKIQKENDCNMIITLIVVIIFLFFLNIFIHFKGL